MSQKDLTEKLHVYQELILMKTKIKDIKVINGDKMLYTLYMYNNRIFELQIKSYNTGYCRHLKNKEAIVAFLVEVHTKKTLVFKEAVEKITWEEIDNLVNEKIKEVEYNNGVQLKLQL